MAGGGDGWWAAPLGPLSPTRSLLPPRPPIDFGFGVNGAVVGGRGPSRAFASSSTCGPFSSSRNFQFDPAGADVFPAGRPKAEVEPDREAYPAAGGVAGDVMDAEVGTGDGWTCPSGSRKPLLQQQRQQQQQQQKMPSLVRNGKSIAERRAERCGFSTPRINTAKFRCSGSPICSPAAVRSPCLTILPGISPTALLDSPVMPINPQALPSPTTGTVQSLLHNPETLAIVPLKGNMGGANSEDFDSSFVFKFPQDPIYMAYIQGAKGKVSLDTSKEHFDTLAQILKQTDCEGQTGFFGALLKDCPSDLQSDMEASDDAVGKRNCTAVPSCKPGIQSGETQPEMHTYGNDVSQHPQDRDQAGVYSLCPGRPADDGFSWRKYGQKQVKGSEYPRSYYKCTHPNCQVKKKVERSYGGQITEIIYKGKHNHSKPQPARCTMIGSSFTPNSMLETPESCGSSMKSESESVWSNHCGSEENASTDCQADGLERMSSTSALTDLSDPMSTAVEKHLGGLAGNLDLPSSLTCRDNDDDVTQDRLPLEGDGEPDSKRRTNESGLMGSTSASRVVREPRVVVQTESEVDMLDDGYRWRKYGQKVVKGNPNPRSYYKCTNPGCSVRKHVERAANDLKSVITTYEGKHNHEVPAARTSGSGSGSSFPPACNARSLMALPGSAVDPARTTGGDDLPPHLKRKLGIINDGDHEHGARRKSHPGVLLPDDDAGFRYESELSQRPESRPPGRRRVDHTDTGVLRSSSAAAAAAAAAAILGPHFTIPFPATASVRDGVSARLGAAGGGATRSPQFLEVPERERERRRDEALRSSLLPTSNNAAGAPPSLRGQADIPLQMT